MGSAIDAMLARESAAPTAGAEPVSAVPSSNEFSKGLRTGMSAATGQLNSLAGLAGEVVGADNFARERYAAAAQNQVEAAAPENAARVSSFRDVGGLRDAFDYGTGLVAQSVPVLGASLATIAATRGKVNPLVAGTLGAAPFTTGGVVEQQQADPVAAAAPIVDRARSAVGTGLGQAALMNAVPVAMGGKLFAPAIGEAAGGLGARVASNLGEAVAGNAAAGVASEALGQNAMSTLNPERDRSQDNERMLEAGVGGAVVGLPFAGVGIAGDTARARKPRAPGTSVDAAPATDAAPAPAADGTSVVPAADGAAPAQRSIADRARELFQPVDRTPQRIAEGAEIVDPIALRDAPPERQAEMLRESDAARTEQVTDWAQRLMDGGKLDEAQRAQLAEAATDFTDRGKQAVVAGMKIAQETGAKVANAVGEFSAAMQERFPDAKPEDGVKLSAISSGADAAITDVITPTLSAMHPELVKNPTAMKAMAGSMRRLVDGVVKAGEIDADTAKQLRTWFGDDAPAVLADLQQRVMPDASPDVTQRYYSALSDLGKKMKTETSLEKIVSDAAPRGSQGNDIKGVVAFLKDYVREQQPVNKSKAQIEFDNQRIEGELRKHFGDKTETVLKAFRKEALENQPDLVRAPVDGTDSRAAVDEGGFADNGREDGLTEGMTERQFFGGGKDKAKPEFMLAEQVHRQQYGNEDSQAARVLRKAQSENPDQNVSVVTARQYARENNLTTAELMERTNGKPDDYVMVKSEGMKREGLTWKDIDAAKLDTHRYPDSPSRIQTDEGTILDGKKLMNMFANHEKLPFSDADAANPMARLRRQMTEAIASVSDHLGEALDVPPDTVVARRGGKDITWGEVQEQGRAKTTEPADMKREAAFRGREAAEKVMRDPEASGRKKADARDNLQMYDRKIDNQTMRGNDPADVLPDTPGARPDAVRTPNPELRARESVNALARTLGDARKAIQEEAVRVGPRGDSHVELRRQVTEMGDMIERMRKDGADDATLAHWEQREQALRAVADKVGTDGRRPLTPKERGAMKDYLAAEKKMDAAQARLEAGRMTTRELDMEQRSMREAPLDRNIHEAEAQYGDKLGDRFAAAERQDADGNPMHAKNFEDRNADGSLPATVRGAIQSKISVLENMKATNGEKNKIAWSVGQKARELFDKIDSMKVQDQAMLASIGKDRSVSSIAGTINELHAKYKDVVAQPKKANAFTERVLGKGDLAPVVDAIKKSDDVRNLQRVADSLAEHVPTNPRAREVLNATNERLSKIMERDADGSTAYNMQRADPANTNTSKVKADVRAHIDKVLGKTVDTEFARMLHEGEFVTDPARVPKGMAEDVIRISVHSLDPMSTAHHESLHGFFKKLRDDRLIDGAAPLFKAADSFQVKEQLERLLTNEPDALQQVRTNLEERAAYMYQFWAAGKLDLPTKATTVLGRVAEFFRKVLGTWPNDQRAVNIMEYFQSGGYAKDMPNRSAVASALAEGTNGAVEAFKGMVAPITRLANVVASTGDARLRDTLIPALGELADKVYTPLHAKGNDPGYVPAARVKRGEFINELATSLSRTDAAVLTDALNAMQRGEKGSTTAERVAVRTVRQTLDKVFDYMKDAGVKVNDLGYGTDYFPRVWDASVVIGKEKEFRAMMKKYEDSGQFTGSVDNVIAKLTRADGSDLQIETIKPGMVNTKERILAFIEGKDAEPFLEKDMYRTLNGYISQATRRAEWARRFGDDGAQLHKLFDRASKEGASAADLAMAAEYLQGVDGTLGDSINPKLRRAFGNMIVYQNIRVLPLALFSSLIDPLGIAVRGGTTGEAFKAFKRGIAEIPKGFKENATHDSMTQLAAQMGVIDSAVLMHSIGSTFSQGMVSDTGRRVNNAFFKYNLMEQYNTSMRVAGTESAINFLGRHADGKFNQHSTRWLAELGMQPGEVIVKNGRPLLSASEFEAHGYSPARAQGAADKMSLAVNKWVDGAVLRPNAAHKPIWMNDPHYALVSHLKQFVYSFQETILKRVANETRHGNLGPAYALASYVPFMMAADLMKGFIVGGGAQPDYKESWGLSDYLWSGMQRAGLFGVGQFGIDTAKDMQRGGSGLGALSGPTVEQLGDAASTVFGTQQFKTFALNALPANQLLDGAAEAVSTNVAE